ncbi:hypothetical protein [Microbacterium arborescens]|jgi:hypothetical protein|uniref:hypothetical protein n=1 Tax=Microbacterium TaxID=33882 RepID=UPI0025A04E2F|nr:hypothetical protein [Microbacterium arborescens]WJM16734.1 hypothetical protein QUC20_05330 [Microbacterium arborescens]
MKFEIHPAAPSAIASGAVVLAGLDVFNGLLAVRDDEAHLAVAVSVGLRLFGALCILVAFVAALLARRRRGLQVAGVLGVALVAIAVVLVGCTLAREASMFVP